MAPEQKATPSFTDLKLTERGAWARLTLASGKANPIGGALMDDIHRALDYIERRSSISVLSFSGRAGVFCAGANLNEVNRLFSQSNPAAAMRAFAGRVQETTERVAKLNIITVAEIDGAAMGGGLELALACDFRLASDQARLGLPETGLGLIPAAGGTFRLRQITGMTTARKLILTGAILKPDEALGLGLVDLVVGADQAETEMTRFIEKLAARPASALLAAKACFRFEGDAAASAEIEQIARLADEDETKRLVKEFISRNH
ncbi:MAG: enoyl-CoA hydratase/isomerase family protein [Pseudomonadota bacterium]